MSADASSLSDVESRSPGRASTPHKDQEMADRQMIRHLLCRYTMKELERLLTEERRSLAASKDGHSPLPVGQAQDESSDVPGAVANANPFSDSPSACESVDSSGSVRANSFRGRKRKASSSTEATSQSLTDESSWEAEDAVQVTMASKQKGSFTCGFCLEEGIKKTCTRKNDLKRHIEDFHHTDAQWFCRHRGCQMVFDWQTAYKAHLKSCHGGCRMNLYDAKVALCPQTVFACGFENCTQVFEATSDLDAAVVFREYVAHVVKHFDEGVNGSQWSYSARMRNLLRQSSVIDAFTQAMWPEAHQSRLEWETQSSSVLRKRLETRHLGDVQYLVQYAIALGSSPSGPVESYRPDFITPIRSECGMTMRNHIHSLSRAANLTPESDHHAMQYDLSGVDASFAQAALYASQRPAYVPAQSAQPHMASSAYGFHDAHHPGMRQPYSMMPQPKTEHPYMDLELASNPLLGPEYPSHPLPELSSTYPSNELNNPATTETCAAAPTSGTSSESRPAYSVYTTSPSFGFGMKMGQIMPS